MAFRSAAGYAAGLEVKESLPVSGRRALCYLGVKDRNGRSRCMITSVGDGLASHKIQSFCKTLPRHAIE
jgi:hypothetical protein